MGEGSQIEEPDIVELDIAGNILTGEQQVRLVQRPVSRGTEMKQIGLCCMRTCRAGGRNMGLVKKLHPNERVESS